MRCSTEWDFADGMRNELGVEVVDVSGSMGIRWSLTNSYENQYMSLTFENYQPHDDIHPIKNLSISRNALPGMYFCQ